ncbi:porin family protein [Bartonella sp. 220]|uniref:outer membrane protein n=1 Tax=Bartonella sp. 220B TaxID=2967260 RepID=UPI0022A8E973|nr:outer membrane protein [Bartonella sp. 220B]MCZ2158098.1 porin family protein [Bartonella sp. 220B]
MNIKSLITTSVIALVSASAAQAADVVIPHETAPVVTAPAFSWTGFYIGAQIGGFSSKVEITNPKTDNKIFDKKDTPNPSGFMGGIYAGSNFDLGNNVILGVETDAVWADRDDTKPVSSEVIGEANLADFKATLTKANAKVASGKEIAKITKDDKRTYSHALKEKWSGATRVRIGFAAADHIMPYVAGGIAYAQLEATDSVKATEAAGGAEIATAKLFDKTKTFVGYTIGGGVDFAMTDNVLLRAEYRYSDFGKKSFVKDSNKINYKTNDFRVGVAYKF